METLDLIYARHNRNTPATQIVEGPIYYHELTVVLKGSLTYYVNGKEAVLQGGDAVFLPHGAVRRRPPTTEQVDYISFNFHMAVPPQLPAVLRGAVTREVQLLIGAFDEVSAKAYLDNRDKQTHLLACLLLVLEDGMKTALINPLALKIMRHLHENYMERITLADVAALTAFSAVYCDTVFRRETGKSIIDYLIDIRVDMAKKLLIEGSLPVSQVAELTGFQDGNYFCRVFKKRTGDTPSSYRKRLHGL